jgi:hypothetical protein
LPLGEHFEISAGMRRTSSSASPSRDGIPSAHGWSPERAAAARPRQAA